MGLDGSGLWGSSMRLSDALVTAYTGKSLGSFFWTGKSSVMSDTHSDAVLCIYDVRHL